MRISLVLLLITTLLFSEKSTINLTYMTEDYPPYNYHDEYGILQGSTVEIIQALWEKIGIPSTEIQLLPWARAYMNIQTEKKQVLFTMSRSKERENLFKWVGPISSSQHLLVGFAQSGDKTNLSKLNEIEKFRVGVVRKDVGEQVLLDNHINENILVRSVKMKDNISNLINGRVDFISIGEEAYLTLKKRKVQHNSFYIAYTIGYSQDYIAFSKDVPDNVINLFQGALDAIEEEHKAILKKYGLSVKKQR